VLTELSIRGVILIEHLDMSFRGGFTTLTGETGAGKSILLDSLGLALGQRSQAGLVAAGHEQASVTACFAPAPDHPVYALLADQGIDQAEEIILRRLVMKDGRSRAYVNDQTVSTGLQRQIGALLVEIQGQHEQLGLLDPAQQGAILDTYGGLGRIKARVTQAWTDCQAARTELREAMATEAENRKDEDWLRHAVEELSKSSPEPDEEERLAAERLDLQQQERYAAAIASAMSEIAPAERRTPGIAARVRNALRALERVSSNHESGRQRALAEAMATLMRAEETLAEAETQLTRLNADLDLDTRKLEQVEERLFDLRALARKHNVAVPELADLHTRLAARLASVERGEALIGELSQRVATARRHYEQVAADLSAARQAAATRLTRAVAEQLTPLRLGKARFSVDLVPLAEANWGANGVESAQFLIATNPGHAPAPLAKVVSGGESSRLLLALKVVLAAASTIPTLVFDEIDSGVGGATAAAVGERLAMLAQSVQVLAVTHSPQVAAFAGSHLRILKQSTRDRAVTSVDVLADAERREEIARMLAGETVTEAARSAADVLLRTREQMEQGLL